MSCVQTIRSWLRPAIIACFLAATFLSQASAGLSERPGAGNTAGAASPGENQYLPAVLGGNSQRIASVSDNFYYGVLESAGFVGNSSAFARSIQAWQSHGFDAALIINMIPDLSVSDRMNFKIIASPLDVLYRDWYFFEEYHDGTLCGGEVDIDCAREIIGPIVEPLTSHPSVRGYYIYDDGHPAYKEEIRLAVQVFREHDPENPASPGLLELGYGQTIYDHARPGAFITYDYTVLNGSPPCDFSKGGSRDWVDRTRETMQAKPMSTPFWAILQTHGSEDNYLGLRTPTVEEVRLLNWLALGEDAKGIFWFTWSTDLTLFWTGIQDNPALLTEITDLARRANNLQRYLASSQKISDKFQVTAPGDAYISTLKDFDTGRLYVLAANHSCTPQDLTLSSWSYQARLRDLETGEIFNLGSPLAFRGGDGRLFEVVDPLLLPKPAPQPNLVGNPSFETDSDLNGVPDGWGTAATAIWDTSIRHSGRASLRITGASDTSISQPVTLKPATKYYVSWFMKAQDLVESNLGIQYVQTSPSIVYLDNVFWNQNGAYDWVKRVGFFETPADYQDGKIQIRWNASDGSTYWIDDLTLCEAGKPCADAYLQERE